MGTRNLTCVYKNGECKVAQYGQFDGYPEGQGTTVLTFLKTIHRLNLRATFEKHLDLCNWASEAYLKDAYKECGGDENGTFGVKAYNLFGDRYPELHRNTAANILYMILEKGGMTLENALPFAGDSLYCEWCYVIDLDKNVFEVYKGFNKKPTTEKDRFHSLFTHPIHRKEKYYPVTLLYTWSLDNLPKNEEFLKTIEDLTKEEE